MTFQRNVTDNEFPDGTFTLQKGDTIVWTHTGAQTSYHSISTTAGSAESFDSHPNCTPAPVCMLKGDTYTHKFDTVGSVPYHCKVHAAMTGNITVVESLPA